MVLILGLSRVAEDLRGVLPLRYMYSEKIRDRKRPALNDNRHQAAIFLSGSFRLGRFFSGQVLLEQVLLEQVLARQVPSPQALSRKAAEHRLVMMMNLSYLDVKLAQ
ncbi:hypothetical protein KIN20_005965 [Parelaphostrongylus tenuis]|uniref:Uncharacterized protein n=1 Tax=Parelaphostrongylus tenuis TaxID=148309 RepID=A0AAD5MJH8_PARTN|nr:hypothetical protein KIN20_005965 [Parelaphostrongylus tenuis]